MTEEKNIDASKQENQSQGQFGNERLSEKELEKVAGGAGYLDNLFNPSAPKETHLGIGSGISIRDGGVGK